MNELLTPEATLELERLVNSIAQRSAQLFDTRGELEPAVFAIALTAGGESDVRLLEGGSRFFSGLEGKDALSMVVEHILSNASPGMTQTVLIVTEAWATFGAAAEELAATGGSPSMSNKREEVISMNLVLPGGITYLHFLRIEPSTRKILPAPPFRIEIDPGYEARSRFARRPTQH